jgi:hypothetical protein
MCIVADPPTFIPMFKPTDPEHAAFVSVRDWVIAGPGKFVMGGAKYKAELFAVRSVLPFLAELERRGKIVRRSDADVDADEMAVKRVEPANDFDDPHLVALVRLTGCRLICIRDPRSHRFLRAPRFYRTARDRPKLYTRPKNIALLGPHNLAACCK